MGQGSGSLLKTNNGASAGGYKNYLGHSKHVKKNIYVHPEWRAGSFGGNAGMCVQDVGNPTLAMWCGNTMILFGAAF